MVLEEFCTGFLDFDKTVIINGHLFLSVDDSESAKFMVNEKVCKTANDVVNYLSNSYATKKDNTEEEEEISEPTNNSMNICKDSKETERIESNVT